MEVCQDNLCLILDLEGFFINKTFHSRELGYFTWYQEHGRHAFFVPVSYKTLCDKDKRTVNFVISKIHGLSYQLGQTEHAQNPRILGTFIVAPRAYDPSALRQESRALGATISGMRHR